MSQSDRTRGRSDGDRDDSSPRRGWFRRHPIWTTLILVVVVLLVIPLVIVGVTYNRTEIPRPGSVATNQISEIYTNDGTTMIGHALWCSSAWEVEPRSIPAKPPRPRVPTTTRSTAVENSARRAAPVPSRAWRRIGT